MSQTPSLPNSNSPSRRSILAGAAALTLPVPAGSQTANPSPTNEIPMSDASSFWPNGARLAVSFSLMSEARGHPISGAGLQIPDHTQNGLPDLPTHAFFASGGYEAIP